MIAVLQPKQNLKPSISQVFNSSSQSVLDLDDKDKESETIKS